MFNKTNLLVVGIFLSIVLTFSESAKSDFYLPTFVSQTGVTTAVRPNPDSTSEVRALCEPSGIPQFNYSHVDVVVVMLSPVCVTQQTVKLLRFNFNFRNLIYVVKYKEFCPYLLSLDDSVRCLDENDVLPGVSYKTLSAPGMSDNIKKLQGDNNRIGWYFQQYLKVGVALTIPDLSDHYLIWDADNIPIKPFEMFTEDGDAKFCANPSSSKSRSYGRFYKHITGRELLHPERKGKVYNFVCGYMMFYRPYVKEFLSFVDDYVQRNRPRDTLAKRGFPWSIHSVAEELFPSGTMFSEYDSYGSWVMDMHPQEFAMDYHISYVRNPTTRKSGANGPEFKEGMHCCLTHKRICALGKELSDSPHGKLGPTVGDHHHILIWEEHKFRYRRKDYCADPLPPKLAEAIHEVGTGMVFQNQKGRGSAPSDGT
ncbi:hypothetical protein CYMTET_4608 [Cymbomonas tetramitiformis]|uniref:Uncharacterized protein n=1 Tax=Cymbomonas tetramitiformis TaxID=36881 RepID=A0AAE0H117_9CHLO|nr:hypothetical protein CYMTET_4608 [Cymbomonas tetramitiformis]